MLSVALMVLLQAPPAPPAVAEEPRQLVFANRYSLQWSPLSPVPSGEVGLFLGSSLRPRPDRHGGTWRTALGYELAVNVGGADRSTAFYSWGGNYGLAYHHHHLAAVGYGGPHARLFYQFGGGLVFWRSTLVAFDAEVRLGVVLGERWNRRIKLVVGGEVRILGILDGVPLPHPGLYVGLLLF